MFTKQSLDKVKAYVGIGFATIVVITPIWNVFWWGAMLGACIIFFSTDWGLEDESDYIGKRMDDA